MSDYTLKLSSFGKNNFFIPMHQFDIMNILSVRKYLWITDKQQNHTGSVKSCDSYNERDYMYQWSCHCIINSISGLMKLLTIQCTILKPFSEYQLKLFDNHC